MKFNINKLKIKNYNQGFSLVEVILAIALFALIITGLVGALIYGEESTALSGKRTRAAFLAEEGLEAARNIKDENFQNVPGGPGPYGIAVSGNQWTFSGIEDITQDAVDRFTRQIQISTIDSDTKEITSNVTWNENEFRTDTISLVTRFTNWKTTPKGGILVYGNSAAPTDRIMYKVLNGATGIWSAETQTADIDSSSTNRILRAAKVYSSPTRNEKILVSRHYNGTTQYIYAQVFNGSSWGNVILLSSWNATTYLDVQNFDGSYLNTGYFMVAYSDNTTIPKFRVWTGFAWSASSISMQNLGTGGIPNYIALKNRPGTNEAMAAFFDQASDTNTQYFNGGAFIQSSWALHTEHSTVAPLATKRFVDFDWSPNNSTKGALVYSDNGNDRALNIKIWTANGSGGGAWSATANTTNQSNQLGAVSVAGRKGADEFIACDKDALASPQIICYESNFTPAWINPANQILVSGTHTGIQRSYHIGFEGISGTTALGIFSNNTAILRLKKYDAVNNSWDATASAIATLGSIVASVRLIPQEESDDIMILAANDNLDLYSVVWNGNADAVYTTPAGKALTTHGLNGSVNTDFWYDFAWNKFE
jgi:prepilin-type N-terminal cleavage/methylation domain-containing protein